MSQNGLGRALFKVLVTSSSTLAFPPYRMLAQSLKRPAVTRRLTHLPRRCYWGSQTFSGCARRPSRISIVGGGALAASFVLGYSVYADTSPPLPPSAERTPTPLSKLVTSYVVYSLCSIPGLVDASPALLAFCTSVPGLRQLTEAFIRATFFTHVASITQLPWRQC